MMSRQVQSLPIDNNRSVSIKDDGANPSGGSTPTLLANHVGSALHPSTSTIAASYASPVIFSPPSPVPVLFEDDRANVSAMKNRIQQVIEISGDLVSLLRTGGLELIENKADVSSPLWKLIPRRGFCNGKFTWGHMTQYEIVQSLSSAAEIVCCIR